MLIVILLTDNDLIPPPTVQHARSRPPQLNCGTEHRDFAVKYDWGQGYGRSHVELWGVVSGHYR